MLNCGYSRLASARGAFDREAADFLVGLGLFLLSSSVAAAEGVSVGLGVDYSTGHYGESVATDILFIPAFLKWELDPWTTKLTVSYVRVVGPGSVVPDGESVVSTPSDSNRRTTQSGIGDTTLSIGRALWTSESGGTGTELTAKVKFPTADEQKGLGTGETDASLSVDAYSALGTMTVFAGFGYRWPGDPPGSNYRNVWMGNAGLSLKLFPSVNMGVLYDYRQATRATSADGSEVTPFASFKIGAQYKLQWYATIGLSSSSADRGMGLVLQRAF